MSLSTPIPVYPCAQCGEEHERSALILEGKHLICKECWEEGFNERFDGA